MIFGLYHSPAETAGLILDILKKLSLPFTDVHLYRGDGLPRDISGLEGLVVMGGPMNVDEGEKYPYLVDEVNLISRVLGDEKPVLGICLGAQLMAKALGSRIYPNRYREVGWMPVEVTLAALQDPFFKRFPKKFTPLHWHGDTFDLPTGAVHLARSTKCENQAFRWGKKSYGLQFHLEIKPNMVNNWCNSSDGERDIAEAGENSTKIKNDTPAAFEKIEPISNAFFQSYFSTLYAHLRAPMRS